MCAALTIASLATPCPAVQMWAAAGVASVVTQLAQHIHTHETLL
jgi:hypothetical protein